MSETRTRPTRACTARTPSRLSPLAPAVKPPKKQRGDEDQMQSMLVFSNPTAAVPDQKDRHELRQMWELASIINFFNTFRPILKLEEFSAEDLEDALLTSNDLLVVIHTTLLKGIYPPSRVPLNRESWTAVLYKKLKDRWSKVAEPPFPLEGYVGNEATAYSELGAPTRLIILRALCEIRLDQDDVRAYMEEPVKKGSVSTFRKERSGSNLLGTTYWCENNPISGYRLYRDIPKPKGKEFRGRTASPPPPSRWETLACNFQEFQSAADTLTSSKFKQEIGLGKRLKQEVLPVLEAIEKKKARDLKRKQRQANLLQTTLENQPDSGRTRRDRKPVNYTFPEYDRSINEAIKSTRKQHTENANGHANGHVENSKVARKERVHSSEQGTIPSCDKSKDVDPVDIREGEDQPEISGEPTASNEDGSKDHNIPRAPRSRQRWKSQRYCGKDYVDFAYEEEDDLYSDDEIEGEAIYHDDFLWNRKWNSTAKRKRGDSSSLDDEEYRADDQEYVQEDAEDEEDLAFSYSEESQEQEELGDALSDDEEEEERKPPFRSTRHARKLKTVEDSGLRRSKRATRSKVNYKAYEDSEVEEEHDDPPPLKKKLRSGKMNGQTKQSPSSLEDADYSIESAGSPESSSQNLHGGSSSRVGDEEDAGQTSGKVEDSDGNDGVNDEEKYRRSGWSHENGDEDDDDDVRRKQLRFFDLNECAPVDSPGDWMRSGFLDEREAPQKLKERDKGSVTWRPSPRSRNWLQNRKHPGLWIR